MSSLLISQAPGDVGHVLGKQLVEPPVLGGNKPGGDAVSALDGFERGSDVGVEAVDRVGKVAGCPFELRCSLGDRVLEDSKQELILAFEVAVEGLQRNTCFLHELLRRESFALLRDQPSGRVDHRLGLRDAAGAGPMDERRSVGGAFGPAHSGDSTTTGISRAVRSWYAS